MNEIEKKAPGHFSRGLRRCAVENSRIALCFVGRSSPTSAASTRIAWPLACLFYPFLFAILFASAEAIKEDELSYVIGKEAATQKKIEKALEWRPKSTREAAGCILQFVGRYAFMAGILKERKRCKEYIGWLLQQLKGGGLKGFCT